METVSGMWSILSAGELASLGSIEALSRRLGFSASLLSEEGSGAAGLWSPSHYARGSNGVRSCFRASSEGVGSGCGVAMSLRVVCGLPSFKGVGLFTTTCSCGCLAICAFRSPINAAGGSGVRLGWSGPEIRWVTLPPMQVRSPKRTRPHFLEGVGFSGNSGSILFSALRVHGQFVVRGFGG